jgi:hypothetical protein
MVAISKSKPADFWNVILGSRLPNSAIFYEMITSNLYELIRALAPYF